MFGLRLAMIFSRSPIHGEAGFARGQENAYEWVFTERPTIKKLQAAIDCLDSPRDDYDKGYISVLELVLKTLVPPETSSNV